MAPALRRIFLAHDHTGEHSEAGAPVAGVRVIALGETQAMLESTGANSDVAGRFELAGVLVSMGVGGSLFLVFARQSAMEARMLAEEARMEAEVARHEALKMRDAAEKERLRADQASKEAAEAEHKAKKAP